MPFSDLHLIEPLLRALAEEGYAEPTPIQVQAVPHVLAGRDLLGIAQTGTGKTAAFALPLLQRLAAAPRPAGRRPVRVLVVAPTRELAAQVAESFRAYGRHLPLRTAVVFGGVNVRPQVDALMQGVDVLVATPGRLLDLLQHGATRLDRVETCVLDEADRMLDMGFLPDVRRILAHLPAQRQTLFFSATMAGEPQKLADRILKQPARVEVAPQATTVERVRQSVVYVEKAAKQDLLARLLADPSMSRTLVFTRTKHGANKVVARLAHAGIRAEAIHANKSQNQRERALASFKAGRTAVLVATDIAARGLDVDDISHVVNFDLPNIPESYVHRIGRTARAGAEGSAISFCDATERTFLRDIEREIRMRIPVLKPGAERQAALGHGPATPEPPAAPHEGARPHAGEQRGPPRPEHRDAHPGERPAAHAGGRHETHGSGRHEAHGGGRPPRGPHHEGPHGRGPQRPWEPRRERPPAGRGGHGNPEPRGPDRREGHRAHPSHVHAPRAPHAPDGPRSHHGPRAGHGGPADAGPSQRPRWGQPSGPRGPHAGGAAPGHAPAFGQPRRRRRGSGPSRQR